MKITKFTGINNVQPAESLLPDKYGASALREAVNVDIDLAGEVSRREGYTLALTGGHVDVWEGAGFQLAVVAGDLVRIVADTPETLVASVGSSRMWYCNFPDGRTGFSNDTVNGLAGLTTLTGWGVPTPANAGTGAAEDSGQLYAGSYRWAITYVRSDGVESAPAYSESIDIAVDKKLALSALPTLADHTIRVYLTHHNGTVLRLAGETDDDTFDAFTYDGKVESLIRECLTEQTDPAPVGRLLAFWGGRALVAVGPVLWACRQLDVEHFELDKDFKQFSADITMVQPVQDGIFIGTEQELVFLRGASFRELAFDREADLPVVLGSGATVPGNYLTRGDGDAGQGDCMVCIADGFLLAGYQDGGTVALTERSYRTAATEVCATFRVRDGIPQYVAIPR